MEGSLICLHLIVMSLGGSATKEDGDLIAKLFGSVGKMWRADEKLFDAITGLRYMASVNAQDPYCLIPCRTKLIFNGFSHFYLKRFLGSSSEYKLCICICRDRD